MSDGLSVAGHTLELRDESCFLIYRAQVSSASSCSCSDDSLLCTSNILKKSGLTPIDRMKSSYKLVYLLSLYVVLLSPP